jgi:hypothetical protein
MRALSITAFAVTALLLAWQSSEAAPARTQQLTGPQARSLGECVRIANDRGWRRGGEKGRLPFLRRCMQGKVG